MKNDYVEYNPEVLRRIQQTEIMMLKDFAYACDKYKIDYWCGGGTAIGALRHQGMIPWDDDIDLVYRRRDEERLIDAVKTEFGDKYWFANPRLTPGFPYIPTHMCLKGTKFQEKNFDAPYEAGIFLDLYPYDDAFNDEKKRRAQGYKAWFWGKLYVLYFASKPVLYLGGLKASIVQVCCKLGNVFLHLFRVNPLNLYERALKHATACERLGESSDYVCWFFNPNPFTSLLCKSQTYPTRLTKFEDTEIRVPNKVEEYLTQAYGDYMTMPPEDQRHNHPPAVLEFNDEYC